MIRQTESTKSILLRALAFLLVSFSLMVITACSPGTAGYDWHSGEMEIERTPAN